MADWNILADELPPPDTYGIEYEEIPSYPTALFTAIGNPPTEYRQTYDNELSFTVKQLDHFYNIHTAHIEVDFRLIRDTGAVMTANDVATLINGGWSLFSRAELYIGGSLVERVSYPGVSHRWHALAAYSPSEVSAVQEHEWIYLDEIGQRSGNSGATWANQFATISNRYKAVGFAQPYDTKQTAAVAPTAGDTAIGAAFDVGSRQLGLAYNAGYAKRFERTQSGKLVRLHLPLRSIFGFAELQKPIRGAAISVRLQKNQDYNTIIHTPLGSPIAPAGALAAPHPRMATLLQRASMWIKSAMPSRETLIDVESDIQSGKSALHSWISRNVYPSEVYPSNTTRVEWDLGLLPHKPVACIIGIMSEMQYGRQADGLILRKSPAVANADIVAGAAANGEAAGFAPYRFAPYTSETGQRLQNVCANGGMTSHLNDIRGIDVKINGMNFPAERYRMSFANEDGISRAYVDYLAMFDKGGQNSKCLPFEIWKEMPLFCFQFEKAGVWLPDRPNIVRVELDAVSSPLAFARTAANTEQFGAAFAGRVGVQSSGAGDFQLFALMYFERSLEVKAVSGFLTYTP